MCVSVTFWRFFRDFEDEMDGFEKSAKTARTPPQVPFQTRTRAQSASEVAAAAAAAEVAIAAVNTTDTDNITDTENLSQHKTGTLNPTISDPILVDLSSPGNSHATTGARSVTDARVMLTDDSSAVADVSPTVGVLQPTLLRETLLELNEARTQMDIYRQRLEKLEDDYEAEHQQRQ